MQQEGRHIRRAAWGLFSGLFVIFAFFLLFGPKAPDAEQASLCVVNLKGPGPFGLSLNCDSVEFMILSRAPARLFDAKNARQNRPGLPLLASVLRIPLEPLASVPVWLNVKSSHPGWGWVIDVIRRDFPGYVAYIFLNLLLIVSAFWLFVHLAGSRANGLVAVGLASLGSLLAVNDVTKAFLWSPHTTLFIITMPLLAVFLMVQAGWGALARWQWALAVGALIGLGITAYSMFALIVPYVLIAALLHYLVTRSAGLKALCANASLFVLASIAPMLTWYVLVRFKTGTYYDHDFAEGRLVWIADAFARGDLAATLSYNAQQIVTMAAWQGIPVFLVFIVLGCVALFRRCRLTPLLGLGGAVLLTTATAGAFMTVTGITHDRVAYGLLPPVIALLGALFVLLMEGASELQRRLLAGICLAAAIGQLLHTLLKAGPYS